jgi:hypothetical protein
MIEMTESASILVVLEDEEEEEYVGVGKLIQDLTMPKSTLPSAP